MKVEHSEDWLKIINVTVAIETLIEELRALNADDSPARSRQASLAITKLEEGSHWLADWLSEAS